MPSTGYCNFSPSGRSLSSRVHAAIFGHRNKARKVDIKHPHTCNLHYGQQDMTRTTNKASQVNIFLQKLASGMCRGPGNGCKGKSGLRTRSDSSLYMVIHGQCCARVEVTAQAEGLQHGLALSHVCQQSQLKLPIVCHNQRVSTRCISLESFAHLHVLPRLLATKMVLVQKSVVSSYNPACLQLLAPEEPSLPLLPN